MEVELQASLTILIKDAILLVRKVTEIADHALKDIKENGF